MKNAECQGGLVERLSKDLKGKEAKKWWNGRQNSKTHGRCQCEEGARSVMVIFFEFRGREAGMIGGGLYVVSGLGPREAGS